MTDKETQPPEQLVKVLNDPHANGRGCDLRLKHLKYLSLVSLCSKRLPADSRNSFAGAMSTDFTTCTQGWLS